MTGFDLESGEKTPLLAKARGAAEGKIESTSVEVSTAEAIEMKKRKGRGHQVLQEMTAWTLKEQVVMGLAVVCFVACFISVVFLRFDHISVMLTGCLGLYIAPNTAFQQRKLSEIEALDQTNDLFKIQIDQFKGKNENIRKQIDEAQATKDRFVEMEKTLAAVNKTSGNAVDQLEKQLQASRKVYESMEQSLTARVLRNFMSIIDEYVDIDRDGLLSDDEIKNLVIRLNNLNEIEIKQAEFVQMILDKGRKTDALIMAVKEICEEDREDSIITYKKKN